MKRILWPTPRISSGCCTTAFRRSTGSAFMSCGNRSWCSARSRESPPACACRWARVFAAVPRAGSKPCALRMCMSSRDTSPATLTRARKSWCLSCSEVLSQVCSTSTAPIRTGSASATSRASRCCAARSQPRCRKKRPQTAGCSFDARDVAPGSRVNADHLALLHEQRHPHHGAGRELGRLHTAAGGIAPDSGVCLHNLQFDEVRRRNQERHVVPQRDLAHVLFLQPVFRLRHGLFVRCVLLVGVRDHEMPELAVGVEVLHIGVDDVSGLDAVTGLECLVHRPPGAEIAYADAIERLALAGLDEFVLHDDAGVAVHQDLGSATELACVVVRHTMYCAGGRPELLELPYTSRLERRAANRGTRYDTCGVLHIP